MTYKEIINCMNKEASKARQAIIESIEHWYEDGIVPNEKGWKIIADKHYIRTDYEWYKNNSFQEPSKLTEEYCSLCAEASYCLECIWYKACGRECYKQEYGACVDNCFSLKSCHAMLHKLWSIGRNDNNLPYNDKIVEYYFYL